MNARAHSPRGPFALAFCVATVLGGVSTWLVLHSRDGAAALAVAGAGAALTMSGIGAKKAGAPGVFADSVADRGFDGLILGVLAWAFRAADPMTSFAALTAMGASFMAAYASARARSLAYGVDAGVGSRIVRYALVAAALATGRPAPALWISAGLSAASIVVRAAQIPKEERA